MSCEFCTDEDGEVCLPIYGLAPHEHIGESIIGSTHILPKEQYPPYFEPDPEEDGMGTWYCPYCR